MHGKEAAIAPPFAERLAMRGVTPGGLDTDTLGTFTGEVPRAGTAAQAAIAKARLGMSRTGLPLGVASEGSYGPHPQAPFLAAGVELMVLVDDERGLSIVEQLVDEAPCFEHATVACLREATQFLSRAGFPAQAVVVQPDTPEHGTGVLRKGLRELADVETAIRQCAQSSRHGRALLSTDMRAHQNPTRMATISRLAVRLAERVLSLCAHCGSPGYGEVGRETGLPCSWCGGPSILVHRRILGCARCDHRESVPRSDGLSEADPRHCPACNP